MSNEEKSICIIEFLGKKTDCSWSEKFLFHGKWRGYKKLLVITHTTPGVEKIPTQDEYESVLEGEEDLEKKIVKLGELNDLAHEDLILLINTSSSIGKVMFGLVKNAKSEDFLDGNCKVAWNRLVRKYALHIASSLLKLKSEFHNSKLKSIDKDPNEWIYHLEGIRTQMNEFGLKGNVSDEDFMIQVLNNLPKEYDVILNGLENHLTATKDNALNIDSICEKLNYRNEKIKNKKEEKIEIKTTKKKTIRKQKDMKIKIENLMECVIIAARDGILAKTVKHGSMIDGDDVVWYWIC